jgi:hypothetical protein
MVRQTHSGRRLDLALYPLKAKVRDKVHSTAVHVRSPIGGRPHFDHGPRLSESACAQVQIITCRASSAASKTNLELLTVPEFSPCPRFVHPVLDYWPHRSAA